MSLRAQGAGFFLYVTDEIMKVTTDWYIPFFFIFYLLITMDEFGLIVDVTIMY